MAKMIALHLIFQTIFSNFLVKSSTACIINKDVEAGFTLEYICRKFPNRLQRSQIKLPDNNILVSWLKDDFICEDIDC